MTSKIGLALCGLLLWTSCTEKECEGLSDCPCGFVCVEGACVAGTCRDAPPRVDLGPVDGPEPGDGPVDADLGDVSDVPDIPDISDMGELPRPPDGGEMGEILPNRNEVVAGLQMVSTGEEYASFGYLQNRSAERYLVSRQSFAAMGETCELVDRQRVSGTATRFFVQEIQLDSLFNEGAPRRLFSDANEPGRYASIVSTVPRFFIPGSAVDFAITAGPAGDPASLGALAATSVVAPTLIQALTPSVAAPLGLEAPVFFTWTPSSVGGASLRIEARSADDLLTLTCVVADDGGFTLPAAAGAAFLGARGMREATLSVLRVASTTAMLSRDGGGSETVELRVEVGARYTLR